MVSDNNGATICCVVSKNSVGGSRFGASSSLGAVMNLGAIAGRTAIVCALHPVELLSVNVPGSSEDAPNFLYAVATRALEPLVATLPT